MYIQVEDELKRLQKEINKIEDKDSDYTKNEKWKELRHRQDMFYNMLREEKERDERCL
jgi:hypothetical protein